MNGRATGEGRHGGFVVVRLTGLDGVPGERPGTGGPAGDGPDSRGRGTHGREESNRDVSGRDVSGQGRGGREAGGPGAYRYEISGHEAGGHEPGGHEPGGHGVNGCPRAGVPGGRASRRGARRALSAGTILRCAGTLPPSPAAESVPAPSAHEPAEPRSLVVRSALGSYTVLVLRGGGPATGTAVGDVHLRAALGPGGAARRWRECADVLYSGGPLAPREAERVLRDHPGCGLVAGAGDRGGCSVVFRGGARLAVFPIGPSPGRMPRARIALLASFLHGWRSSPRPVEALASAVFLTPGGATLAIRHG